MFLNLRVCRALRMRYTYRWASQVVLVVKNSPANAGDIRDVSLLNYV